MHTPRHPTRSITIMASALLALFLLSFVLGRYGVPLGEVVKILLSRVFSIEQTWTDNMAIAVWNVRLPRILLACLVGCGLSAAGTAYQTVFQNPMAAPDILGASSGACFGAALAILTGQSTVMVTVFAFLASLLSVALVYLVGRRSRGSRVVSLLLAGIMVGSLFSACTSYIKLVADPTNQLPQITYWLMGSLSGTRMHTVAFAAVCMAAGLMPLLLLRWRMNLLTLSPDEARAMGVHTDRLRLAVILCATVLTASAVSVSGMIGWGVAAVSLFFLGLYYTNRNLLYASSDFASVLYTMTMILLFLLPAISMRSFAEERKNRTDQLLLTSPVSIPAIVAGKFLAEVAVFALPLAAAVLMPLILKAFGTVSLVAAYSAVLGYLLLGSACLAVGTWISALTENQILAYLATFGALLVAYIMDGIQTMFTTGNLLAFIAFMVVVLIASILVGVICKRLTAGVTVFCVGAVVLFILFRLRPAWLLTAFNAVLSALALFDPFQDIVGGMFSIPAIVYYLSVIGLFLFLTGQALERRRWN